MDEHISALQCTQCSYLTRNLNVLFSHCMISHAGEPVEVRLYQCPFCEMKCSVVNFLEEHIETVHSTGYNVMVNEVIRFIFNSGHHFNHRSNFNNHPNGITTSTPAVPLTVSSPSHVPPTQNWSTYSSSNYAQQQVVLGKREFNWKVPELNPTYGDAPTAAPRQSTNYKPKRNVKTLGTWYPPPPPLSLNHQAQQEQTQQPAQSIPLHPPLTPAPNTLSTYQVAPASVYSGGLFSCTSVPSTNSTASDNVAALITPRNSGPAPTNIPIQHLMLSSQQTKINTAAELGNTAATSQNYTGQYSAAQVYYNRLANLAQRFMITEDGNPHLLQDRLQNIMKRQAPLILRQQGDHNQPVYPYPSTSSNGRGTSSEVEMLLNQETSTQHHIASPTSPSTQSFTQDDVLKSSQLSNGSTSSVGQTLSQSPDVPSNSINTGETVESGDQKSSDKVVRIQCRKCPESFDNAKALFYHRHFHHEGIVTKGRKLSQLSCYSQNNFINTNKRKFSTNNNLNSNAKKHHEIMSKEEENELNFVVTNENENPDGINKTKTKGELAIDLTVNANSSANETENHVDVEANLKDVNRNHIIGQYPSSNAPYASAGTVSTVESINVSSQLQPAVPHDLENNGCVSCGIHFVDKEAMKDHFIRTKIHKTAPPRQNGRKTRQKKSGDNSSKSGQLKFGSVTRLRLNTPPKSLRLRNKDNLKSKKTAISRESTGTENSIVYSCTHCNTTISSPCLLLSHCWQKHKIRPLRCSYCHQYFVSSKENAETAKTQLLNHLLTKHGALHNDEPQQSVQAAPIRPSQCYYCNKVFMNKPAVKQHIKEDHLELNQNSKKPRYSDEMMTEQNEDYAQ